MFFYQELHCSLSSVVNGLIVAVNFISARVYYDGRQACGSSNLLRKRVIWMRSLPPGRAETADPAGIPPPVEYLVAVERFLARAAIGAASRRVYRVSLAGWAWPLVGEPVPPGAQRRHAVPPMVPLAVLDDPATAARLAAAVTERAALAGARTVNRELAALRSATAWWQGQQWIRADPASTLRNLPQAAQPAAVALSPGQVTAALRAAPALRERAFWQLLYDSGAPAAAVLTLDIGRLDLPRHRARLTREAGSGWIHWSEQVTQLLGWLIAGRADGPVFLSGRRAAAGTAPAGSCPVTRRARMSYRRAAEIFAATTRPLDPAGRGWTLHQLSQARRGGRARGSARAGGQPKNTSASA